MAVPIWTNPPISHFSSRAVPRSESLAKEAQSRVSGWCGESPKSNAGRWRQCGIFLKSTRKPAMHRVVQIILFVILGLFSSRAAAPGEPPPVPPAQPTPIPLTNTAFEAQSALTSLQESEATVSKTDSRTDAITASLSSLTSEIDPRIAEDTRLLRTSPSLDVLYRIKLTWRDLSDDLSALARELSQEVKTLEDEIGRLDKLSKAWEATLQSAKQHDTPPPALESVQRVVDSVGRAREVAVSGLSRALTMLSRVSDEETKVRKTLSSVQQSQIQALKDLSVRSSPPIWSFGPDLGREWGEQTSESFSSQVKASTAFTKRLPFTFLIHASLVVLFATALLWARYRVQRLAQEEPDLQRALPILDVPVSTAFVLSILISPSLYPQAPRLIHAVLATLALVPAVVILRRLLGRTLSPVLKAIVIMYFLDQIRLLAASLPQLARLLFLGQMLGGSLFLLWLLRSRILRTGTVETSSRSSQAMRAIAVVGLVFLLSAFLANAFGYIDLGNLLAIIFLRSVYVAALLYASLRIFEGLIIISLRVRPLSSLRVVSLYRPMLQQRAGLLLGILAVMCWLSLMLGFFGLLTPLITTASAALNANIGVGSLSVSLGGILAFLIAIWASFLISKFLRFLLEEDVYQYFLLAGGVPHAISTLLHYLILLVGFFIALGALGIDLTKITILAGAFSVGIGFGLQNVINNFVSGLILLFERPIKIGDVIEVGGKLGEVRRIGIRASVIRAADGSEVIVPNGSLISNQVTNWTLSDRGRAVDISVSVAGGSNVARVKELLKSTAAANPDVVKKPAPQVYVVTLTASAVTFQLQVWTDRHEAWAQLRSDLSIAVNEALTREKIAIV
jgi:potassium-dependent mechanosensitive channel